MANKINKNNKDFDCGRFTVSFNNQNIKIRVWLNDKEYYCIIKSEKYPLKRANKNKFEIIK